MDAEYGGVMIVPMIIGLVEVGKRLGLGPTYAAPLAVGLGLLISVGYTAAAGLPGGGAVADATLRGLMLGLSAAGLYSGVKSWQEGSTPATPFPAREGGARKGSDSALPRREEG